MPTANSEPKVESLTIPATMQAAVYTGKSTVSVQSIPTPRIGPGEILIRVEACGICHTDLKKIEYNLLSAPRVYGHETAGVVAAVGDTVTQYAVGDRVIVFHHIPCLECFYCRHGLYAQCPVYKKVGVTAGFEAAGGGFSQYVRVMDWIVKRGVEKIPDHVSFERASFVEPLNTCLKAIHQLNISPEDVVMVLGQGPIGLIFTMLVKRLGATLVATDTMPHRRDLSLRFGAALAADPRPNSENSDLPDRILAMTSGRGADKLIVAASAPGIVEQAFRYTRPGASILLFAQTSPQERIEFTPADICVGERKLFGSYSASVDLQKESANLVFGGNLPLEELISHCFALNEIRTGIDLALHPEPKSLKIIVQPQRWS